MRSASSATDPVAQEQTEGGSAPGVGPSGIPATGAVLLRWTIASLVLGAIGGLVGLKFGAPYYFGFFFGFTLTGLSGLFAVADHVSRQQNRRR